MRSGLSRASVTVTSPSRGSLTWVSSAVAMISRMRTASRRARAWSATSAPSRRRSPTKLIHLHQGAQSSTPKMLSHLHQRCTADAPTGPRPPDAPPAFARRSPTPRRSGLGRPPRRRPRSGCAGADRDTPPPLLIPSAVASARPRSGARPTASASASGRHRATGRGRGCRSTLKFKPQSRRPPVLDRHSAAGDLPLLVGLDHVVDLDVVVTDPDTALVALEHLAGVVLEAPQRLDGEVVGDDDPVPDETCLAVPDDRPAAHEAAGDVADPRHLEDVAHLGGAELHLFV